MLLAIFAKYFQNWRILLRIMYIPALVLFVYFWILPESVRWLLSQKREEEAKNILRRAARVNKRDLPEHSLDKLILANREKLTNTTEGKFPIKLAFTSLFWRIANCSFCWIVNVLVYYGLSLNAVLLDGDKYNNFVYIAMVEIPGFLLPLVIMDRFGRRRSLFGCMFISGLCCLATIFMPKGKNVRTEWAIFKNWTNSILNFSLQTQQLANWFCFWLENWQSLPAFKYYTSLHRRYSPPICAIACYRFVRWWEDWDQWWLHKHHFW